MKTLILALILMMALILGITSDTMAKAKDAPALEASAQGCVEISAPVSVETTIGEPIEGKKGNFFTNNWGALFLGLLSFYDVVARLTPTKKDNSIVNILTILYNALVPNLKKGGGKL